MIQEEDNIEEQQSDQSPCNQIPLFDILKMKKFTPKGHKTCYFQSSESISCCETIEKLLSLKVFRQGSFKMMQIIELANCEICLKNISREQFQLADSSLIDPNIYLGSYSVFDLALTLTGSVKKQINRNITYPTCGFQVNFNFETFLCQNDPYFLLLKQIMSKQWENRREKKRTKIAARQALRDFIDRKRLSPQLVFSVADFHHDNADLKQHIMREWVQPFEDITLGHLYAAETRKRAWISYLKHKVVVRAPSPQTWTRPRGFNFLLMNKAVEKFYLFKCGSNIFPANYKQGDPNDFFEQSKIPDGAIVNPPYKSPLIDRIVAKLVYLAKEQAATFAVLVPFWEKAPWFRILKSLNTPIFELSTPLTFRRGEKEVYTGLANFHSAICLIGAYTTETGFQINNDALGFPIDTKYLKAFEKIRFPDNLRAKHSLISTKNL